MDLYVYLWGRIVNIQSYSPADSWAKIESVFKKLNLSVRVTGEVEPPGPALPAISGGEVEPTSPTEWTWKEFSIPMADGKTLAASIRVPDDATRKYPAVLIQTPYGKHWFVNQPETCLPFISDDYAYVIVDMRGYYASSDAGARFLNAGLDGYAAVEWIAAQEWSDGKVGTWGPSALGAVVYLTAANRPPHLVCAVPVVRNLRNDYLWYFPGGVFREAYHETISLAIGFPKKKPLSYPRGGWDEPGVPPLISSMIDIPMLFIGGWYDHHTLPEGYGIIQSYFDMQASGGPNARGNQRLVMGPWTHTDCDRLDQGQLQYPKGEGIAGVEAEKFFNYWLRGIGNGYTDRLPIRYFLMGTNRWLESESWPPPGTEETVFYLQAEGKLSRETPRTSAPDLFRFDPHDPMPTIGGPEVCYRGGPIRCGPFDQRQQVESRDDVLTYTSNILESDFTVTGSMQVRLCVSSDRFDTDFAVRLCDVYPDGRSMLVTDGIRRMRFRYSYREEKLMVPGEIYCVTIDLSTTALTFLKGHRIRISVTSSNYPRFHVNPNNGGPLYKGGELLVAINTVYHDAEHPSAVVFMPTTFTE